MTAIQPYVFLAGPVVFLGLQAIAVFTDVTRYRIPNWVSLSLAAAFPLIALCHPYWVEWGGHIAAAVLLLALGCGLYLVRCLGAGDGKLLAAAGLWVGWESLADFLLHVVLLGGALAVILFISRILVQGLGVAIPAVGQLRFPTVMIVKQPIPYGVAIAGASALIYDELWIFYPSLT